MMPMLFSIIVPAHNAEKTLPRAIDSFLASAKQDRDELIVVLDGEKQEASVSLLEEYASKTPMVRYLYPNKRNGALGARMLGIQAAKGEYVGFLDADDYYAPTAMDEFAAMAESSHADILNFSFFTSTSKKDSKNFFTKSERSLNKEEGFKAVLGDSFIRGFFWSKIISRRLLQIPLPGPLIGMDAMFEDTLASAIYFARAESSYYSPKPLYHYVKDENPTAVSRPRTNRAEYHLAAFAAIRLYLENWTDGTLLPIFYKSKFRSRLSLLYDLSQDKKFGLDKVSRAQRKKEFDAIFNKKAPLVIQGTSYQSHVSTAYSYPAYSEVGE